MPDKKKTKGLGRDQHPADYPSVIRASVVYTDELKDKLPKSETAITAKNQLPKQN